jgi:hypothetical protein
VRENKKIETKREKGIMKEMEKTGEEPWCP